MGWLRKLFGTEEDLEIFRNQGTTRREREVARLLNQRMGLQMVETVRMGRGSESELLAVTVELHRGRILRGPELKDAMSAREQAEAVYEFLEAARKSSTLPAR